jgi:WW domain-containing oxidoreductase
MVGRMRLSSKPPLQPISPKRISQMAKSIPFGPRSTADQVLAGVDLTRKQMVVTGCDSDIGFETMKALIANGAHVVGVARTLDDARASCSAAGPCSTPLGCDLTDVASVDAAVESIRRLLDPLDAVITHSDTLNLTTPQTRQRGEELASIAEPTAHFMLVNRLAELIRSGTGRIVIGSNDASIKEAPAESVPSDNPVDEWLHDPGAFRARAKLATPLFAKELSRRFAARSVLVNSFHFRANGSWNSHQARRDALRLLHSVLRYFTKSPAQRAATPALLAASPLVEGITGQHWSNCQITRSTPSDPRHGYCETGRLASSSQ